MNSTNQQQRVKNLKFQKRNKTEYWSLKADRGKHFALVVR